MPLIFDIEASALELSYPIEIGIADTDTGDIRAWLIRPAKSWALMNWWATSEKIHGLPRELLYDRGTEAEAICAEIVDFVANRPILSDNPTFDRVWLNMLFEEGGLPAPAVPDRSLPRELAQRVHAPGRDPKYHDALIEARVAGHVHTAAGDAAAWAAAIELAGRRAEKHEIDATFEAWARRATGATPWRAR